MQAPLQAHQQPIRTHRRCCVAHNSRFGTAVTTNTSAKSRQSIKGNQAAKQTSSNKRGNTVGGAGASQTRRGASPEPGAPPPQLPQPSQFYNFITGFPFPLGPTFIRGTKRYEVERDTIWTFEQTQALEVFDVYTPVRMTVIKLKSGGLWVHAPIAPTDECVRLVKELGAPVEYIVLPTFAYEHKVFVGPFSRAFPQAKVYVAPYQWSFPLNLPLQFFGIFPSGELLDNDTEAPWSDEIEQKLFLPPSIGVGDYVRFSEVAFFHKRTRTLLVTDAVVYVDDKPPDVVPVPSLLELARDNLLARFVSGSRTPEEVKQIARPEPVEDTPRNRLKGWMRMVLLVLYFNPYDLLEPEASFAAISKRLFVGPVVEVLVYSKVQASVRAWVDDITSSWSFRQVIPCHFAGPVQAGPAEFKRAFAFVYQQSEDQAARNPAPAEQPSGLMAFFSSLFKGMDSKRSQEVTRAVVFPEPDMRVLNALNNGLLQLGLVKANADN